jgi:diaminobutyrate-2-oxoglutarate transaminase
MFAFEHAGIQPDVVVLSKAIGGGQPMSMVVYHEKLDVWGPGAHAGTFRGNQLGMAAGLATIRTIREQNLVDHAARMGELFVHELRAMAQDHACMGDVRGLGLMLGVEIINPWSAERQHGQPVRHGVLARRIQAESFARGLILELGGRQGSVVRLLPPLIVTEAQVRHICAILREAVAAAELALQPEAVAVIEA